MALMVIGSDAVTGGVGSSVVARGRVSVLIEDKSINSPVLLSL